MFLIHPLHFSAAQKDFSSSLSLLSTASIWRKHSYWFAQMAWFEGTFQKVTEYFQWRLRQLSGMSLTLWMTMTGAHSGTFHTQVWQFLLAPCIWRLWNYQHRGCTVFSSVSILYVSICRTNPRQFVGHWYFPLYRYSCPDLVVPYSEELISRPLVSCLLINMMKCLKGHKFCQIK